jgi:hypothetical protein
MKEPLDPLGRTIQTRAPSDRLAGRPDDIRAARRALVGHDELTLFSGAL